MEYLVINLFLTAEAILGRAPPPVGPIVSCLVVKNIYTFMEKRCLVFLTSIKNWEKNFPKFFPTSFPVFCVHKKSTLNCIVSYARKYTSSKYIEKKEKRTHSWKYNIQSNNCATFSAL